MNRANVCIHFVYLFISMNLFAQAPELKLDLKSFSSADIRLEQGFPLIVNLTLYSTQEFGPERYVEGLPDSLRNDPSALRAIDSLYGRGFSQSYPGPWYEQVLFVQLIQERAPGKAIRLFPLNPLPPGELLVGLNKPAFADFGADPQNTVGWVPGRHTLKAGVLFREDTLWSKNLHIEVVRPETSSDDKRRLQAMAHYLMRRGQCDSAAVYGRALLDAEPQNTSNIVLMAEIDECTGDLKSSLTLYRRALEAVEKDPVQPSCPPVYLVRKINELQDKLYFKK
ncbi:MAG: hypothetical protein IT266_07945 [Saprospiraceae bacterium]|nr:hypothetical protein [Saprospiraceae bacterium]